MFIFYFHVLIFYGKDILFFTEKKKVNVVNNKPNDNPVIQGVLAVSKKNFS